MGKNSYRLIVLLDITCKNDLLTVCGKIELAKFFTKVQNDIIDEIP